MADEEIYFQCPNCETQYDFDDFHKLEHMSHASPGEGPEVLGQAKCRNCSKDFYYYLTGDGYPITVGPAVPPDAYIAPPWIEAMEEEQEGGFLPVAVPACKTRWHSSELGLDLRNRQDLYKQLDKLEEYEYLERKQAHKNSIRYYKVCFAYQRNKAGEIINIDTPDIEEILTPEQLQRKCQAESGGKSSPFIEQGKAEEVGAFFAGHKASGQSEGAD